MVIFASAIIVIVTLCELPSTSSYAVGYSQEHQDVRGLSVNPFIETLSLHSLRVSCSLGEVCGIAACDWHRDFLEPDHTCTYMRNGCTCSHGTGCLPINPSFARPEAGMTVFQYHCQSRNK